MAGCLFSAFSLAEIDDGEPITLERAYQIALERSPRGQLLEAQLEAIEGQVEQARLRPNPTIGAEVENVLGTGALEGVDGTEVTFGISQLLERREKRERRAELATRSKELYRWNYEEAVTELRYEVKSAFSQALVAQENVDLQTELLELAQESESEVARRATAAKASSIELSQAQLASRKQEFELDRARRRLAEARTVLASLWNETSAEHVKLAGMLELESELPSLSELSLLIDDSPAIARYQAEKLAQEAAVDLQRAEAKGDIGLFGGVRYLRQDGDDAAFVVGFDIPWRIRNRNQGNIRSAMAGLSVVESQRRIALRQSTASLAVAYRELSSALQEWQSLKNELLPSAETALEETRTGYQRGIITLLNVLDARRALFEIRSGMLESTERYFAAQTEIERLTTPSQSNNR